MIQILAWESLLELLRPFYVIGAPLIEIGRILLLFSFPCRPLSLNARIPLSLDWTHERNKNRREK
jgi:hypothetical protein